MPFDVRAIDRSTWIFEDSGVRFFLLEGKKRSLLIDSGMTVRNVKNIASGLTAHQVLLLNTHADPDHIGGNREFDSFYMNPAEAINYYKLHNGTGEMVPVWDGDIIDLGDRPLKIITTPGHTPGSIAVLDIMRRIIFTGDPIQTGRIFMFGIHREMHAYRLSLLKLNAMSDQFDLIYPSHAVCPVEKDLIMKLYEASGKILDGSASGVEQEVHGKRIMAYDMGIATFLCDGGENGST
ncbi:MAG: MBL fold metallo-hydrolase [Spirochaetales bacterium]|nr:MBL fold metallo-hydrolase [Spirochaetales bacterium]